VWSSSPSHPNPPHALLSYVRQVFEDMLADTNLPEMLVEPMLASWLLASGFQGSSTAIRAAVSLSQQVVATAENASLRTSPRNSLGDNGDDDDAGMGVEEDDEEAAEESRHRVRTLASIRALQVVSWSLQQHIGNRDGVAGFDHYDAVVPFIVECLSQPCPDLRGLSVRCLGLLSLASQEKCQDFHQIILQVSTPRSTPRLPVPGNPHHHVDVFCCPSRCASVPARWRATRSRRRRCGARPSRPSWTWPRCTRNASRTTRP